MSAKTFSLLLLVTIASGAVHCEDKTLDIQVRGLEKQSTLVIRRKIKKADLSVTLGAMFSKVFAYVEAHKIKPLSMPFARYKAVDADTFEVEGGVIVGEGTRGDGDIVASELPAGKAAVVLHTGAYDKLEDSHSAAISWLKNHKFECRDFIWEVYISDPASAKPEELKTELYLPLKQ